MFRLLWANNQPSHAAFFGTPFVLNRLEYNLGVVVSAFGEISPRIPTILFVRSLAFVASLSLFFPSRLLIESFFLFFFFFNSVRFVLSFLHIRDSFVFSYLKKIMFQLIFFLFHSFMLCIEEIGQGDSIRCYLPHFDLFLKNVAQCCCWLNPAPCLVLISGGDCSRHRLAYVQQYTRTGIAL